MMKIFARKKCTTNKTGMEATNIILEQRVTISYIVEKPDRNFCQNIVKGKILKNPHCIVYGLKQKLAT